MTITINGHSTVPDAVPSSVFPPPNKPSASSGPAAQATISAASVGLATPLGASLGAGQAANAAISKAQAQSAQLSNVQGLLQQLQQLLRQASDSNVQGVSRQAIQVSITGLQGELGQLTDDSPAAENVPGLASTQAAAADLNLPGQNSVAANTGTVAGISIASATSSDVSVATPAAATAGKKVIDQTLEQIRQRQLANDAQLEKQFGQASNADASRLSVFQTTAAATLPQAQAAADAASAQIWNAPSAAIAAQGAIPTDSVQALAN